MGNLARYNEAKLAKDRNDSHVRRNLYRSAPDGDRDMIIDAYERVDVVRTIIDDRPVIDALKEEKEERKFWHMMTWVIMVGCFAALLLTLLIVSIIGG